ncbi:MAG: 4Fe-4S binding protein, partial [Planctomycetota bacterium]
PQCVRCSACVQSCPTGVLQFGRVAPGTGEVVGHDRLAASPVIIAETGGQPPVSASANSRRNDDR